MEGFSLLLRGGVWRVSRRVDFVRETLRFPDAEGYAEGLGPFWADGLCGGFLPSTKSLRLTPLIDPEGSASPNGSDAGKTTGGRGGPLGLKPTGRGVEVPTTGTGHQ